jgi:predicted DNA-binding protein (UPF0251 family)
MERITKSLSWIVMAAMAIVYVVAQAAAFTHMHAWSMEHLPDGTSTWFGWANAVISEIIPTVGMILLFIAEAKTKSKAWAVGLLIFGLFLSGNAQLAEAKNLSYSALFVALLPAVAAAVLLKVSFGLMDLLGIGSGEGPKDLGQPAQVSHLSSPGHPAQVMAHTPARGVAQTSFVTQLGHPGPVTDHPVGHPETGQVAHDEAAGQTAGHPVAQVSQECNVEVAHAEVAQPAPEVPNKVAQPKPRATRKVAQKPAVGQSKTDPGQVARAVEAVRSGRLTQRAAATEYGISRTTLQRAMTETAAEPALTEEEVARLSSGDIDAEFAKWAERPDNET